MPMSVLSSPFAEESCRGDSGRVRTGWPTRSAEGNQLHEVGTPWSPKDLQPAHRSPSKPRETLQDVFGCAFGLEALPVHRPYQILAASLRRNKTKTGG